MVYIPRRRQQRRLSSVGHIPKSKPITPASAIANNALANLLENVSGKLLPAILELKKEEREEGYRTDSLAWFNDTKAKVMDSDGSSEYWDSEVAPMLEKAKDKEWFNSEAGQRIYTQYLTQENSYKKNVLEKGWKKLREDKLSNSDKEFTSSMSGLNANDIGQINKAIDDYYYSVEDVIKADFEAREGRAPSVPELQELSEKSENELIFRKVDEKVRDEIKNKSLIQVGMLAGDSSIAIIQEDLQGVFSAKAEKKPEEIKKLIKKNPHYNFLALLSDHDVDMGKLSEEVDGSLKKKVDREHVVNERGRTKRKRQLLESGNRIGIDIQDAVRSGNKEQFKEAVGRYFAFAVTHQETAPELQTNSRWWKYTKPNGYELALRDYEKGNSLVTEIGALNIALKASMESESSVNFTDPLATSKFVSGVEGIPLHLQSKVTNNIMKLHRVGVRNNKGLLQGILKQTERVLENLQDLDRDNKHQEASGLGSPDDYKHPSGKGSKGRRLSKYVSIKKDFAASVLNLINQMADGQYSLKKTADNYVGKGLSEIYREQVAEPLQQIISDNMHTMVELPLTPSNEKNLRINIDQLKLVFKQFKQNENAFGEMPVGDRNNVVNQLFIQAKKVRDSYKHSSIKDQDILDDMTETLLTIKLIKDLPYDMGKASGQISDVSKGTGRSKFVSTGLKGKK